MLAMNFRGPRQIRLDRNKPEPEIKHPYDAIVRVTRSLVCGSDLHLYHGRVPDTRVGMTFGHEFTGIVEAVGSGVQKLKAGPNSNGLLTTAQIVTLMAFQLVCRTGRT